MAEGAQGAQGAQGPPREQRGARGQQNPTQTAEGAATVAGPDPPERQRGRGGSRAHPDGRGGEGAAMSAHPDGRGGEAAAGPTPTGVPALNELATPPPQCPHHRPQVSPALSLPTTVFLPISYPYSHKNVHQCLYPLGTKFPPGTGAHEGPQLARGVLQGRQAGWR